MKSLSIQLQTACSPGLDVTVAVARFLALAPATISRGEDDGPNVNITFQTADLPALWAAVRQVLQADAALAGCAIVVCQGKHGWDDYRLLHHFDPSEPLDEPADARKEDAAVDAFNVSFLALLVVGTALWWGRAFRLSRTSIRLQRGRPDPDPVARVARLPSQGGRLADRRGGPCVPGRPDLCASGVTARPGRVP